MKHYFLALICLIGCGGGSGVTDGGVDMIVCPAGWGDCNGDATDGCETPLFSAANCGACGRVCQAIGGTNSCVSEGGESVCKLTCDSSHVDCDGDKSNGCEFAPAVETDDPVNVCNDQVPIIEIKEGTTVNFPSRTIQPAGDVDIFHLKFADATGVCIPSTSQDFAMIITLNSADSSNFKLRYQSPNCESSWKAAAEKTVCVAFKGVCGPNDQRHDYLEVSGANDKVVSCEPYTLTVRGCKRGSDCNNCK